MAIDLNYKIDAKKLLEKLSSQRFVILRNHNIDHALLNAVYSEWREFFADDRKKTYLRQDENDEGFVPSNTEFSPGRQTKPDPKEFYQTHTNKDFPRIIVHEKTKELLSKLKSIALQVIRSLSAELKKHNSSFNLEEIVDLESKSMFRAIHYPESKMNDAIDYRAAPHGDICLFTMIPAPSTEGLEFVYENGQSHKVTCEQEDIIFFNSDMVELYTNGYLKSAKHLVSNKEKPLEERYSCPLFIHAKRAASLTKDTQAIDALRKRLSEIGYNGEQLER